MWLADGTFSAAPRQFLQLYTIHGYIQEHVYPFIIIFVTRRTQAIYTAVLTKLVDLAQEKFNITLQPRFITTDFEQAAMNAFRELFPDASLSGCHFHLCHSIIRRCNDSGLKTKYRDNKEFGLNVRMLMALAYLPVEDVATGFELVNARPPSDVGPELFTYFDTTYVNGPVIRGSGATAVRRPPLFAPAVWNTHDRYIRDILIISVQYTS